ncbi:MFS transporter [Microcella frigidaquae]|uniref:MFS family permease n=1 Tax=Microcella frigidaquae TaxID=424758 RepID=A0A840X7N1_9MICO|nr:MFS transporter [Microcella frigidaquae]MBB5618563.1 MFS family permease [Microcella frigidaquae]NHN43999.1 MFS transporter [Microcella frigidaquae]
METSPSDSERAADRRTLTLALTVTMLVQFAQQATRPMASYRALGLDASVEQLGYLAFSFAVLAIAVAIPIGRLVDRRGARLTTVGGIALMGAAAAAHALATDLVTLVAAHTALGLGLIGAVVGLQAIVAHAGPAESADARFGMFGAIISLGQVLGPIVAGGLAELTLALDAAAPADPFGTTPIFVLAGALCTAGALAALGLPRHPGGTRTAVESAAADGTAAEAQPGLGSVLRAPHMGKALWASLVVLSTTDVLTVYLPAIGAERGWTIAFVSILLAVRAAASFAVRIATGPLVRMLGRRPLLVGACGIGATALLLMVPMLPGWVALVLMGITGLVLGIGQPLTMAWVSRSAPDELRATALAVRLTGNRIGQSLIPVAVGTVAALAGSGAVFLVLGVLLLSTSAAVARSNLR